MNSSNTSSWSYSSSESFSVLKGMPEEEQEFFEKEMGALNFDNFLPEGLEDLNSLSLDLTTSEDIFGEEKQVVESLS